MGKYGAEEFSQRYYVRLSILVSFPRLHIYWIIDFV